LQRLKLKCDEQLSNVAFKFNVRRYTMVFVVLTISTSNVILAFYSTVTIAGKELTLVHFTAQRECYVWDRGCM